MGGLLDLADQLSASIRNRDGSAFDVAEDTSVTGTRAASGISNVPVRRGPASASIRSRTTAKPAAATMSADPATAEPTAGEIGNAVNPGGRRRAVAPGLADSLAVTNQAQDRR